MLTMDKYLTAHAMLTAAKELPLNKAGVCGGIACSLLKGASILVREYLAAKTTTRGSKAEEWGKNLRDLIELEYNADYVRACEYNKAREAGAD